MGLPFDQTARQKRFIQDHPEWSIHPQDGPSYTAEKADGASRHIVAHPSLKGLLDRLDGIVARPMTPAPSSPLSVSACRTKLCGGQVESLGNADAGCETAVLGVLSRGCWGLGP